MQIQTIDLKIQTRENEELLLRSLRETGFAIVTNHNISKHLLDEFYYNWSEFFSYSTRVKNCYKQDNGKGYFPFKSENAKDSSVKDLKEFYHVFCPFYDDELDEINTRSNSGIGEITEEVAVKLNALGLKLLAMIYNQLPSVIVNKFPCTLQQMAGCSGSTLLRVLHYPPLMDDQDPKAVRAAAHEDINLITLLPAATAPGLQVKDVNGSWHDVQCDPGAIILNVGDMLQELSDGYLKSTTHRVVNPTGENVSRYSAPLFIHPNPDTRLSERYTAKEYLEQRLMEIGLLDSKKAE